MLAVAFYDIVKSVHVIAVVLAFGVTFAYPVLFPVVTKANPRALPVLHVAQGAIGRMLITPFATVALVTGIYMAVDRELFGNIWIEGPLVILIVLLGLGGAFFAPNERRAAEIAQRDVEASGDGEVQLSPEYQALSMKIAKVGMFSSFLVLLAIFLMVAKP